MAIPGAGRSSASAASTGTAPPITNIARQPISGSTRMPNNPAIVAPSGTQTIVSVTAICRCRRGTYSAARAAAFGIAPPRPAPASSRSTARCIGLAAAATAAVIRPKSNMLPSSAVRRPIRSPARPATAPPIVMPMRPIETTGANAARGTDHSRMIDGMATPSSWLSMPSKTMVIAVRPTSHFWYAPHAPWSSTRPTSIRTGLWGGGAIAAGDA